MKDQRDTVYFYQQREATLHVESIEMEAHPEHQADTTLQASPAAMDLQGINALVIGGSGGIGSALVAQLDRMGAAHIYAASSKHGTPGSGTTRIVAETVDITDPASVHALAKRMNSKDLSLVINCAGFNGNGRLLEANSEKTARQEMEVNYFGLMHVGAAFAPMLASNGGGTVVTVLSFLSHVNLPTMASYCASKAAAHSLTQALRAEWAGQGVRFCGVYPTAVDTRMSTHQPGPKQSPAELAVTMLDAISRGIEDLYPGDAQSAYFQFMRDPKQLEYAMRLALP